MKTLFVISVLFVSALARPEQSAPDCSRAVPDCVCPLIWDPVCGDNGCTYGNICQLECACVNWAYNGECRID